MDKTISLNTLKLVADNVTKYTRSVDPSHPFVVSIDKFVNHIENLLNIEQEWESEYKDEELDQWERYMESLPETI